MPEPSQANVRYGAGTLYIAALGSTEPTSISTAWDQAFIKLGFTEAGSTFTYTPAVTALDVAETYDIIKNIVTGRTMKLAFSLAEMTYTHLVAALNGGVVAAPGGNVTFEPPDLGSEVRVMFGWDSLDLQERWIFRQCFQTGAVAIARQKTAKYLLPVDFTLEAPATGLKPFKAFFTSSLDV